MTVDSAVTLHFPDKREYSTGRKAYLYPEVGCVATWGARDGNQIGRFLEQHKINSGSHSVEELRSLVYQYLTDEYRPHDCNLDDVGYHIAGFDRHGRARLFHVFYGFDRPRRPEQEKREYQTLDHSPNPASATLLYNGRNDLAEIMVLSLLDQIKMNAPTRFDLTTTNGLVRLGDFIARFAGELTPEVGPPFLIHLISPRNEARKIRNHNLCPLDSTEIQKNLEELGISAQAIVKV